MGHARPLGEILAEQAVGILVGPALPGMMRGGEVEPRRDDPLERRVLVKLRAIVHGDGPHRMRLGRDEGPRPAIHVRARALRELPQDQVARLPLDQRQHAGPRLARPEHGVPLPMPELPTRLDDPWPRADQALAREAAPAVVAAVAFAPLLPRAAEVAVKLAPGRLIRPDVAIDGLVADRELPVAAQPAGHLLGTPVLAHQGLDPGPVRGRETPIAPGARAAPPGVPVGHRGAIRAVIPGAIAPELPADRAAVAVEQAGNRGRRFAPSPQEAEGVPFGEGDLAIHHGRLLSLGRELKTTVSQVTFFCRACVALTI